jgi:uncharacterized membrane protein YphA (DoxX/SURF4 family)
LLLRLTLAGGLLADATRRLHESDIWLILSGVGETLTGTLLLIGLWTPIVALLVCALQLGMLPLLRGTMELHLLRAAVGLGLAVLGPGARSVDARLFGRRRVEIKSLRDS